MRSRRLYAATRGSAAARARRRPRRASRDVHPRRDRPTRCHQPPQLGGAGRDRARLGRPRGPAGAGDRADAGRWRRRARRGLPPQPAGEHPVGGRDDAPRLGDHPVPAVRVARDPDQGRPDDAAVADGELRRAGLDLPGGQPQRAPQLRAARLHHRRQPDHHVRGPDRPVDGLRGPAAVADPGVVPAHAATTPRRSPMGSRRRPASSPARP